MKTVLKQRKMIIILRIDENCFEEKKNDYNIENK